MCEFFGVSRAAYYAWQKRIEREDPDAERMQAVQVVYHASHKIYGFRRITMQLQDKQGLRINHKAVLRLMRKLGIRSVAREWVVAQARITGLPFTPEIVGAHWATDSQIDVVAINWREKAILLGECKWGTNPVGREIIRELIDKTGMVVPGNDWKVHYAFFAHWLHSRCTTNRQ